MNHESPTAKYTAAELVDRLEKLERVHLSEAERCVANADLENAAKARDRAIICRAVVDLLRQRGDVEHNEAGFLVRRVVFDDVHFGSNLRFEQMVREVSRVTPVTEFVLRGKRIEFLCQIRVDPMSRASVSARVVEELGGEQRAKERWDSIFAHIFEIVDRYAGMMRHDLFGS